MTIEIWRTHLRAGKAALPLARTLLGSPGRPVTETEAALYVFNRMDLSKLAASSSTLESEVRRQFAANEARRVH